MRRSSSTALILAGAALLAAAASLAVADNAAPAAVELSGHGAVPQNKPPPPLHLTDAQREAIREAVLAVHTDVEFKLKATKRAKDFQPAVGAKLPKALKPLALPQDLVRRLPQLAEYDYLKMKDKVLIVDPMSKKIVDMFPETAAPTGR